MQDTVAEIIDVVSARRGFFTALKMDY